MVRERVHLHAEKHFIHAQHTSNRSSNTIGRHMIRRTIYNRPSLIIKNPSKTEVVLGSMCPTRSTDVKLVGKSTCMRLYCTIQQKQNLIALHNANRDVPDMVAGSEVIHTFAIFASLQSNILYRMTVDALTYINGYNKCSFMQSLPFN